MVRRKLGRRKGSRTKGYFFRTGRGWFTKDRGQFVPLTTSTGEKLREEYTHEEVLKESYARHVVDRGAVRQVPASDAEVGEVCGKYLEFLGNNAGSLDNPSGRAKTYIDRGQTLFDFCYGLPGEFFCKGDRKKRDAKGDPEAKRLHAGYGQKLCSELSPADIDAWLQVHSWSAGGWRTRVQAVKRAMNFGVERKMIPSNPIKGYKLPKSASRITYLTPEQEEAMMRASSPAFSTALSVCIRTGARFGCEFAALRPRHIRDHGDRMEWVFKPEETKTGKQRIIRVIDPEIMRLVRNGLENKTIFANRNGDPWTRKMLSQTFRRAKAKIQKNGTQLDEDACMYSTRHTYAKRILEGYWTGKPASISTLARLMGNTVKVCIDHYLQFSGADNEMLWESA